MVQQAFGSAMDALAENDTETTLCDLPIDPKQLQADCLEALAHPEEHADAHANVITAKTSFAAKDGFLLVREIARVIYNGTAWHKKARIVLEYDPQEERLTVCSMTAKGEAPPVGAAGEV